MKAETLPASKAIKAELAKLYPLQKFSVKVRRYKRGSDMISVDWFNGPRLEEVKPLVEPFKIAGQLAIYCQQIDTDRGPIC